MATLLFEPFVCIEGSQGRFDKLIRSQKSKLTCRLSRIQQHSQVGWRELSHLKRILLFDVVGNQPVVLRTAKLCKVSPDEERLASRELSVRPLLADLRPHAVAN